MLDSTKGLYHVLKKYVLSPEVMYDVGFPTLQFDGTFCINEMNHFGDSSIDRQKCRCQAPISLLEENWFLANDCRYHPLKVDNFCRYKCCGGSKNSPGCVSNNFHTCSYIPLNTQFAVTNRKRRKHFTRMTYALDCEFVFTKVGMEVARVSLVSLSGMVVYDTYVRPKHDVLDFNTQFSGIRPKDLMQKDVKSLEEVQNDITHRLNVETILVGHSLHSDLKGLGICHDKVIDTSILYPHFKGFPYRYSLEYLAQHCLGITIHNSEYGHNSIEDAKVCLQLVALKCGLFKMDPLLHLLLKITP